MSWGLVGVSRSICFVTFEFDFHDLVNVFQDVSIRLKGVTWTVNADFQT